MQYVSSPPCPTPPGGMFSQGGGGAYGAKPWQFSTPIHSFSSAAGGVHGMGMSFPPAPSPCKPPLPFTAPPVQSYHPWFSSGAPFGQPSAPFLQERGMSQGCSSMTNGYPAPPCGPPLCPEDAMVLEALDARKAASNADIKMLEGSLRDEMLVGKRRWVIDHLKRLLNAAITEKAKSPKKRNTYLQHVLTAGAALTLNASSLSRSDGGSGSGSGGGGGGANRSIGGAGRCSTKSVLDVFSASSEKNPAQEQAGVQGAKPLQASTERPAVSSSSEEEESSTHATDLLFRAFGDTEFKVYYDETRHEEGKDPDTSSYYFTVLRKNIRNKILSTAGAHQLPEQVLNDTVSNSIGELKHCKDAIVTHADEPKPPDQDAASGADFRKNRICYSSAGVSSEVSSEDPEKMGIWMALGSDLAKKIFVEMPKA
jgi:hypothetical protein